MIYYFLLLTNIFKISINNMHYIFYVEYIIV